MEPYIAPTINDVILAIVLAVFLGLIFTICALVAMFLWPPLFKKIVKLADKFSPPF